MDAAMNIQKAYWDGDNCEVLNKYFDSILDPTKPIDNAETLKLCHWLIAGGKTPDEFVKILKKSNTSVICGRVWSSQALAYRCYTCCMLPNMAICLDCFQQGSHKDHDYSMYHSQVGGACDCGDITIMKEFGFCPNHGSNSSSNESIIPNELLYGVKKFMPRAFLRLIQYLRDFYKFYSSDKEAVISKTDGLVTILQHCSELGQVVKEVMASALTDTQVYKKLAFSYNTSSDNAGYFEQNIKNYERAVMLSSINSNSNSDLYGKSFLDEFMFWLIEYEFPHKLVCMLISMMSSVNYKEDFMKLFIQNYGKISKMLMRSLDFETSDRVIFVSVQLFCVESVILKVMENFNLIHIIIENLCNTVSSIKIPSIFEYSGPNVHFVIDCDSLIIKERRYWSLTDDFRNILIHKTVAIKFISGENLLQNWFSFLIFLQGMNVNEREMEIHVEFESEAFYGAYDLELDASSSPMWSLISHLKNDETSIYLRRILKECIVALEIWMNAVGFLDYAIMNPYQVSFHLPLHRWFSVFLCHCMKYQNFFLPEIVPNIDYLKRIMMHPLQAQVAFYEIFSDMWVRCGLQIKNQARLYFDCRFCESIVDADLLLLQLCVMYLDPDWFLKTVFQRFHVWEWFTFLPSKVNSFLEPEKVQPMLEGALIFITTLMTTHINIGLTEDDVTRKEIVSLLCICDRTHSQILNLLPEKRNAPGPRNDFENILTEVSEYKHPNFEASGTMLQGMFVPKSIVWENEYDPIHVRLRSSQQSDYQCALDRYVQYVRQSGKLSNSEYPWPPYRIPGQVHSAFKDPRVLLHSKTMHGLIFTILFRALKDSDISEQILALTIYLLELAIRFPNTNKIDNSNISENLINLDYSGWFPGNDIITNITIPIKTDLIANNMELETAVDENHTELQSQVGNLQGQENITNLCNNIDVPSSSNNTICSPGLNFKQGEASESIFSLLVALYSKLNEKPDSYQFDRGRVQSCIENECRFGKGVDYVGKLLDRIILLNSSKEEELKDIRRKLWHTTEATSLERISFTDKQDRKIKAKERQKKLIADFARKQRAFLQRTMQLEVDDESLLKNSEEMTRGYKCVICCEIAMSTLERPMGIVVLLQSTSVVGHSQQLPSPAQLPCCDNNVVQLFERSTLVDFMNKQLAVVTPYFSYDNWLLSLNVGWEGGIHAQSCGHYLHMDCHQSYVRSLRQQNQHSLTNQNLNVVHGDFFCPLCRRLSNVVIPINASFDAVSDTVSLPENELSDIPSQLIQMMASSLSADELRFLRNHAANIISSLQNITDRRYWCISPSKYNNHFLLLCSAIRTNLEMELIQRNLPESSVFSKQNICFMPLFQFLSMHLRTTSVKMQYLPNVIWTQLTGHLSKVDCDISTGESKVPLLLRDCITILLQMSLMLPINVDIVYFQHIVQSLYNIVIIQSIIEVTLTMSCEERCQWETQLETGNEESDCGTNYVLKHIVSKLKGWSDCFADYNDGMQHPEKTMVWNNKAVECHLQRCSLHFLRVSSLLQNYLYPKSSARLSLNSHLDEFSNLCVKLGLMQDENPTSVTALSCMKWTIDNPNFLVNIWCDDLIKFVNKLSVYVIALFRKSIIWYPPTLQMLPENYDSVFQYYHKRTCRICDSVPDMPSLCLICGTMICLKGNCCRKESLAEGVFHSLACGAGTAIYLSVKSSLIYIICGSRICLWGTVYLDTFGEEDRHLKRGKPLFLCKERYSLLQSQWLNHSFLYIGKKWTWHEGDF